MGCPTTPVSALELLPGELQQCILSHLSADPTLPRSVGRRPSLPVTQSESATSLKPLSLCSSRLRFITLPHIYTHTVVKLGAVSPFLRFLAQHHLLGVVKSVSILIDNNSFTAEILEATSAPIFWRLLQALPSLSSVNIVCPPSSFPHLTYCTTNNGDAWTFNMPFHHLKLELQAGCGKEFRLMERPFMIFKALPWTDFSVNEGSFLRAYTQYEYFLKSPPSILTGRTIQSTLQLPKPFLRKLKHFNYSAIFPFYNHVSSVMSLIESTMPNLESLSICLSPHPDEYDAINAQEIRESSGKIDFDDVWMEFETSYEVVAFHVGQLAWKAKLRTFKSVDWTFGGEPRKITEERIAAQLERQGRTITYHQSSEGLNVPVGKPPHKWVPQGDGTWQFQLAEVDDVPILEAT